MRSFWNQRLEIHECISSANCWVVDGGKGGWGDRGGTAVLTRTGPLLSTGQVKESFVSTANWLT